MIQYQLESKKFKYESDTEDEEKYIDDNNRKFSKWRSAKRDKHLFKLWKKAYMKGLSASLMINMHLFLSTKVGYFGKNMLNFQTEQLRL